MSQQLINADPHELAKFSDLADRWWDPEGEFRPLHLINPLRLAWIDGKARLAGKKVLDVGCGGGILTEAMARVGAAVKGIDLATKPLIVAERHLAQSRLAVEYESVSAEELASREPARYDVVTCMELLEHVPDPGSVVHACATLLKPGGHAFFATLNRNPKSYLLAIIGAEYLLGLLPRGTHDYAKLIKPSELSRWCRNAALDVQSLVGMTYNPITRVFALGRDTDVNYMVHAVRPHS
jgi:2-polyprenyl-6-hydroxyphenyl methylase / 3-demethylubiquinone-9 3-methyltransferase